MLTFVNIMKGLIGLNSTKIADIESLYVFETIFA
jgi:hypothetical protein